MVKLYYKKGYKYQTSRWIVIQTDICPEVEIRTDLIWLTTAGKLYIAPYYAWDGASGPMIDTKGAMLPSLVHDVLYQLIRMGLLAEKWRIKADCFFKKLIIAKAKYKWVGRIRADYAFKALQLANGSAARPGNTKKEYIA